MSDLPTPFACSVSEAVRLSSIGRTKLYELIGTGALRVTKVGRRTLVDVSSLRSLVRSSVDSSNDPAVRIKEASD